MDNSNWTPKEIRKTILFILGIVLIILGVILIFKDVKTEGSIKLDLNIFSGEIKSGSAGLFLIFFAFFFITLTFINFKISTRNKTNEAPNSKLKNSNKILLLTIGSFTASIILPIIDLIWLKITYLVGVGLFLFVISFVLVIVYIDSLNSE